MEIDYKQLQNIRQHLHANPELSGKEYNTQDYIIKFISKLKPQVLARVGKTGVMACFDGQEAGKTVLVRCELDALPIEESNEFSYSSNVPGVAHQCGHDGHSAILCGLAKHYSQHPPEKGQIVLLWQPAEENGEGANAVLNDTNFGFIIPDHVLALHNLPGYPLHAVVVKNGAFTAAVKSIIIKLTGKTSHAAEPESGINPALAIAEILQQCHELNIIETDKADFALVTPIYIHMGEKAYGTSAGYGEVHLTIRTWDNKEMKKLSKACEDIAQACAKKHKLQVQITWTQEFSANVNDASLVDKIREAATENKLTVIERKAPFKWGEDFGQFTDQYQGAMFGIGAGKDHPALHNPNYDFPDEIIETGITMLHSVVLKCLY
ncbi:MAG: amidohydrolase [Cyclobacteriaceae bacterium]